MSLAAVTVSTGDFDHVFNHLMSDARYENMHMRQRCMRNGKYDLRYLHVVRAFKRGAQRVLEGVISGPGILWIYEIERTASGTVLTVHRDSASPRERARIGQRFTIEILRRVKEETPKSTHHPRRTPGQYYLKRKAPGTPSSHPTCMEAVKARVLDRAFVGVLASWKFALLRP